MNTSLMIGKTQNGSRVTLSVKGSITTDTAPIFSDALLALDYTNLDLTIDLSQTAYITSVGLRALLVARKKLSAATMRVVGATETIADVFAMTGFDSLIHLEKRALSSEDCRLSFAALLSKRVEQDSNKVAFIFRDLPYTWQDVEIASQLIADDLSALGVKKGTHVGLCSRNCPNWIFTFFAIQKLGGIAILINPSLHAEEVCTLVRLADITHLCYAEIPGVTTFDAYSSAFQNQIPTGKTYNISNYVNFLADSARYSAISGLYRDFYHADDACVIIFSSGSTGLPKAVLLSSYNLLSPMDSVIRMYQYSSRDTNLAFLPLFHIFGFSIAVSMALLCGFRSVIPEGKSPETMMNLIDRYQITIFNTVPTMMLAIIHAPSFSPKKLKSLRASFLAGAITTEEQMLLLQQLLPWTHFGNSYGMSENAAITATEYNDTVAHITQTVGKPLDGVELIIRNPNSAGEGEICVRSSAMSVCYYKLPVEQQPLDDEGFLATGDLGFLDEDGYLHLTGRIKDLIICNGENISPGEVAGVLSVLPEVADVKVLGIPDETKGELVGACIVLKPGCSWDEEKVRTYAAEHLAKFKQPVQYFLFDAFPLLGSGKVDSIALKKMMLEKFKK